MIYIIQGLKLLVLSSQCPNKGLVWLTPRMAGHFVQLFEHAEKNLIPSLVQVLNTGVFKAACAIMEL